jgi:hypothetical protein
MATLAPARSNRGDRFDLPCPDGVSAHPPQPVGFLQPTEMRRRDPLLRGGRQGMEDGIPTAGIELAEDIVDQVHWQAPAGSRERFPLGELERKGEGALLALAGEFRGGQAVDREQ